MTYGGLRCGESGTPQRKAARPNDVAAKAARGQPGPNRYRPEAAGAFPRPIVLPLQKDEKTVIGAERPVAVALNMNAGG
jgi:hypothetical protein